MTITCCLHSSIACASKNIAASLVTREETPHNSLLPFLGTLGDTEKKNLHIQYACESENKTRLHYALERSWIPSRTARRSCNADDTVHASHHSVHTFNLDTPHSQSKHRDHHLLRQAAWWMSSQTTASATSSTHPNATGPTAASHCSYCRHGGLIRSCYHVFNESVCSFCRYLHPGAVVCEL